MNEVFPLAPKSHIEEKNAGRTGTDTVVGTEKIGIGTETLVGTEKIAGTNPTEEMPGTKKEGTTDNETTVTEETTEGRREEMTGEMVVDETKDERRGGVSQKEEETNKPDLKEMCH